MARWLVDGTNVVGSRPDGWWRDRPGAFRRLVAELEPLDEPWTVVFDGRPAFDDPRVQWARVADDRIVELAGVDDDPSSLTVVTSDRGLIDRLAPLGVTIVGSSAFRNQLPSGTPGRWPSPPSP
jgi:hypothetical protein